MQNINAEEAVLGGGCFWCTEAVFSELKGVKSVESGYSGGDIKNPSYKEITTGETGHAEVVKIVFNPDEISYAKLLEVFFKTHDPTTLNRQGADVGTQYRSVIFYTNEKQQKIAEEIIERLNKSGAYENPIVTYVEPLGNYYKAEQYHQDYFINNSRQPYCAFVIQPKMEKFRAAFDDLLKK